MTAQTRNRNPRRARSTRRGGSASPAFLTPYAWYDAHLGGSSTQITDSSSSGRAAAAFGAGVNAPLYLPYTGAAYLHLEAAGTGTNSLSCTAPANTASYSAAPLGGGAPTTGAASAGAFTFTTAGDWLSVALLDGAAAELALYSAASSTQTGHTDSHSVAWTVNRGTAGRKSVVLSPAANSTRSVVLFATNDYLEVPAAAVPPMTAGTAFSVVMVCRQWATARTFGRYYDSATSNVGVAQKGVRMIDDGSGANVLLIVADGSASVSRSRAITNGARAVYAQTVDATVEVGYVNGSASASASVTGLGDRTSGTALSVGRIAVAASNYQDFEFEAILTFDRTLNATEIAQLVGYYQGGL